MNALDQVINTYAIDLTLKPTTFDFYHVCLLGIVGMLLFVIILLLTLLVLAKSKHKTIMTQQPSLSTEPNVKIIEKIVEVEKLVPAPTPAPVVLKESTPEAALQLLSLLQKEARFIDFINEDVTAFRDDEIGAAARVVHGGCSKAIKEHFSLAPVRTEAEGSNITLPAGFDASENRITGNIVGQAPFTGTLIHKGWQVKEIRLPKLAQGYNAAIIAAAEIEL
jgi:hypothetical protein